MTEPLTYRQQAILVALQKDDRMTYRELAAAAGLASWSTIRPHLETLARHGYVTLDAAGKSRSIHLTPAGRAYQARRTL